MLLTSKIEILDEVYTYKLTKPILFWGGSRNKTNFTVLYLPNLVGKVRSSRICLWIWANEVSMNCFAGSLVFLLPFLSSSQSNDLGEEKEEET